MKGILEEAKRKSDGVDKDFLKALAARRTGQLPGAVRVQHVTKKQ